MRLLRSASTTVFALLSRAAETFVCFVSPSRNLFQFSRISVTSRASYQYGLFFVSLLAFLWLSRDHVREPFTIYYTYPTGCPRFRSDHILPFMRSPSAFFSAPTQAEEIGFVLWRQFASRPLPRGNA